ncbi:MAG: hypothetical protein WC867_01385 [Candidatus Pacearchaeota archaeon]|jgi:hypothetical protein
MKKISKKNLQVILIVILLILMVFFIFRAYIHFTNFKDHKNDLKNPEPKIEEWMNVHQAINRFNLPEDKVLEELKLKKTIQYQKLTIDQACKKNHLNCTEIIEKLNNLKKNEAIN